MKTHLFLPFFGEVGWLVMWHMRVVHFTSSDHKIVCCRRGQEVLFPSAQEFFYEWSDPIEDVNRGGANPIGRRFPREFRRICAEFPDAVSVSRFMTPAEEVTPLRPEDSIPLSPKKRGLDVDICIGVRNRQFMPSKNYREWHTVARWLNDKGFSFAIIGTRESSFPLDGMKYMSGDFGDWDAAVELLSNCRLFIGTDSGAAHLCSAVGHAPMIVQNVPKPETSQPMNWGWVHRMRITTKKPVLDIGVEHWEDPQAMIEAISSHEALRTVAHEYSRAHCPSV